MNTTVLNPETRISELREKSKKKQREVAQYLGIPQQTYSNYETGTRELPLRHAKRLAAYYDVSVDYLLYLDTPIAEGSQNWNYYEETSISDVLEHIQKIPYSKRGAFLAYLDFLTKVK